jgi:hypothetical protein
MRARHPATAILLLGVIAAACDNDRPGMVVGAEPAPDPYAALADLQSRPSLPAIQPQNIHVPGGFTIDPLARSSFTDMIDAMIRIKLDGLSTNVVNVDDPSDVLFVKLTFQPGGSVGWHTHPGPAYVAVQQGTIGIINASDCVLRHYPAGRAFIDPGQGNVHVGFNAVAGETVAYVMFLDVPAGQGPTIPASDPGC